jgi:hypothetical protein
MVWPLLSGKARVCGLAVRRLVGDLVLVIDAAVLDRAGELKRRLVEFSQRPRYARALREFLEQHGDASAGLDEHRLTMLWDCFVLEHRLGNGRTVVEQFVDAHPELPDSERRMLLGWRDVVQGPFEVQGRDGPALIAVNLVDELTYRLRSNAGTSVFRRMPSRSFLITRVVAVGDEWMLSGPTSVLRPAERDAAYRLALEISLRSPEAVYRNPEKLAAAWQIQRENQDRFVRLFGSDLVVVPGDQTQQKLDQFWAFCREEVGGGEPAAGDGSAAAGVPSMQLPPEVAGSETVALIYDEVDGLGFYAEFGAVQEAFANPELVRRRRHREMVLSYLYDDVEPMVLRRLADRDPDNASTVFRRLLKRPRFQWAADGEQLLREFKPDYFDRPPRPKVSPVSERLVDYARQR